MRGQKFKITLLVLYEEFYSVHTASVMSAGNASIWLWLKLCGGIIFMH